MRRALLLLPLLFHAACSKDSASTSAPVEPAPPASSASASASAPAPAGSVLGGSPPASAPPAPSASSAARGNSSPGPVLKGDTKLLDPGLAPRKKLRYAWRLEQKEQLAMDLRTSASTEVGGAKQPEIPLPPVHVVIDVDPRSVTPEGSLHYDWRVTAATVTADARMLAQIADGMRTEVAAIEHLAGSATVSSRGLSEDVTVDPASTVDASAAGAGAAGGAAGATGQMVEQVRQTLRDLAVPMPEEDVGKGARWQKISQLEAKGSRLTQTDTFSLVDLQGDHGTVDDVLAQTAPPQALRAPGMQGAQARMESMLASGNAKTSFDLARLVPQSKFDGTTTMVVSGQSPGEANRRVTMVMRVGIDIAGKTR